MIHRLWITGLLIMFWTISVQAQGDALNLPADLYVLSNDGRVDRYGQGAAGVNTVTPDDLFVIDFGVAPGGDALAYRTEESLSILNISTGESRALDTEQSSVPPLRGRGETLAWSPQGDALAATTLEGGRVYFGVNDAAAPATALDLREGAFYQFIWSPDGAYLAGEVADNIWWVYRREADNLVLHSALPSSLGLAFASDFELAFAPAEGGLYLMNLREANAQFLLLDNTWDYRLPTLASPGLLKFFGRQKDDTMIADGFGRLLGLESGVSEIQSLGQVAIELAGLQWASGGSLTASLHDGTLALVEPVNGATFVLPVENVVAYGWGPPLSAPPITPQAPATQTIQETEPVT